MSISDGERISIRFTQALVGNVSGLNPPIGVHENLVSVASISTLNYYSSDYSASKMIDGSTSTYWRGTSAANWIQAKLSKKRMVNKLRLCLNASYSIKTFNFYGSDNASTWTQIGGTYTVGTPVSGSWYEFELENDSEYLYYRLETLTASSSRRIYVYEMQLYEVVPAGNEKGFVIAFDEYDFVPNGSLVRSTRKPTSMEIVDEYTIALIFDSGVTNSFRRAVGSITVSYDGKGSLIGMGGPVMAFDVSFTPESLLPKDNPNVSENISIADMSVSSSLISVFYTNTRKDEHISIASVVPEGTLTHIDDI